MDSDILSIHNHCALHRRHFQGQKAGGLLFGLGAKKVDKNECAKKLRELYVQGGNAWNEFILASNDNLPLQFDRFDFVK